MPPPDWNGSDTFNVVVCDNTKLCDTVTVIVRVLPVSDGIIAVEDNVTYRHGFTLVINQTANDIDEDGTGFSTTTVFDDGSPNGVFTLLGNGNIQYTPNNNFAGIDSFYYVICQPPNVTPRICDTGLIVVVVPVKANNDEAMTDNEKPVTIETRPNDAAVAGAYVSICGNPKNGRVEIIDTLAGTIRYIPNVGFSGADSFCYRLCGVINANVFCSDATVKINVSPPPPLEIPEGISPNNDGINDKFVIKNIERFPKSELLVFNRWGDIVWRSPGEGYKNDFDGTWEQNNQPLPDATYYYVLKLNDGKSKDIAGFLVIHR
ncbi:MAG: Ig-like domain-containing protein [Chitinophagales bacterium]|nr:Ig-like domain-containing protein [Chitinophagales bacterium]